MKQFKYQINGKLEDKKPKLNNIKKFNKKQKIKEIEEAELEEEIERELEDLGLSNK